MKNVYKRKINMNTKELRRYITENIKNRRDDNIDLDFIGSQYTDIDSNHMHGFFNIMHSKSDEEKYLRKELKLAKDSQVIYEFVQNARDAKASEICIYYNSEHFLVINNGNKFNENDISSILDIGQSSKDITDDNIGSFGVGFKIVHRLVGNDDGLEEIVTKYNGPVLFSWDNDGFKQFVNKQFEKLSEHWLFKILYTCFPCGLNERVLNKTLEKEMFFKQNEVEKIIQLVKSHSKIMNFKNGSLFFLSLGDGKYELLKKEENELKKGLEYSLNLLDIDKKSMLNKITINDNIVEKKDMISLTLCDEAVTLLFHKNYQEKLDFYNQKDSRISFYTYFPMSDQKENLNFIIHSSKFDYKTDRRQLSGKKNDVIIKEIAKEFIEELNIIKIQEQEKYISILQDLYLSSLSLNYYSINEGIRFLKKETLKYIEKNIPFVKTNSYGIDSFETTNDKSRVVIVDSQLKNIPLKKIHHFYFNPKKYKDIVKEAVSKLGIIRWNIVQALVYDDISKWILELDDQEFNILLQEIAEKKGIHSQNIVNIWDATYSLKEIEKILKIFKLLNKDDIAFAVIKLEKDQYQIIPNSKNYYIKKIEFREFLEQKYELSEMNIYLTPTEIENELLEIIGKITSDKKILIGLLRSGEHIELIDFIEEYNVEEIFLDTLKVLDINTSLSYTEKSFQSKVLGLALKFEYFEIRERILFNNEPLASSLKSRYINFKHGRVISPFNYDNQVPNEIQKYIDSLDQTLQSLFKIEEDSKEDVFENILETVRNGVLNTYNRLLFVVLYSLELEQNLLKRFNGVEIKKDIDSGFTSLNKVLLVDIKGIKLDSVVEKTNFSIKDFFPNSLQNDYYILDDEYSTENEKLPSGLKREYLETFKVLGLCIDSVLPELRKKILSGEDIGRDELISFTDAQLVNTLEFLSLQNKVYDFDSIDTINIKTIFKQLKSSTIDTFEIFPILKTKSSFELQRLHQYLPKEYITKESINSSNKAFQERLEKEIKHKSVIYLDILDLDESSIKWKKIAENEDEKREEAKNNIDKEILDIDIKLSEKTKYSNRTAEIGRKGELFVKKLLIDKYGEQRIKDNNEIGNIYAIDFEIYDEQLKKIIHKVEVKSTVEDVSKNDEEKVTFLMGKKQYREAQEYENNTYLIFVTGIETNSPEYLCVKADNNWLKPNKQKESLDTSFLSKKEDNLVKPFTLEQNQLSDEKSIINLTKFKSEKNNEVINKLGVIIRRLNKTNLNTNEKISFINSMNNPIIEFSEILQEINTKVK